MRRTTLRTYQDCEDLLEGALWMGTGGGGSLEEGMEKLKKVLDDGLSIEWVELDEIPDDIWTATVGLHGSIAPLSEKILHEISINGLTETPEWYLVKAVKELGESLGHNFECLVPAELGPDSVAIPLAVGAYLGISVVDGDYIGRAVPEEHQSTYCLYEKDSNLFAGVDRWGNSVFVKNTVNTHTLERIAKMLAVASYGDIAVAKTPLIAEEMKKIVVPGTLSLCLKIGQTLRDSRENGRDPIDAGVDASQGWRLFDGTVASLETEDRNGYYFGKVEVKGCGDFQDQTLKVWFKNENQITWLNGSPWICSPDLVTFVYKKNGRGVFNAELGEGDEVSVIGMKGVEGFRTNYGLSLAGPEHFGFDIDYVPIEDLLEKQEATLDSQGV
jgi:uncharacterized protein